MSFFLTGPKFSAFADNTLNAHKVFMITVFDSVEKRKCEKEKMNAGCQHFLLFPQCFQPFHISATFT